MQYVAIDFETANKSSDSACAIGLNLFDENGNLKDSYYSLICPEVPYFDPACTAVHGLKAEDILGAPKLKDIWDEILSFISNRPLIAHNAPFDIRVLKDSAESSGLYGIDSDYYCTLSLSRRLMPELDRHNLTYIAKQNDWIYRAHDAKDDSFICGVLFYELLKGKLESEYALKSYLNEVYKGSKSTYPRHITLEGLLF